MQGGVPLALLWALAQGARQVSRTLSWGEREHAKAGRCKEESLQEQKVGYLLAQRDKRDNCGIRGYSNYVGLEDVRYIVGRQNKY